LRAGGLFLAWWSLAVWFLACRLTVIAFDLVRTMALEDIALEGMAFYDIILEDMGTLEVMSLSGGRLD
jgi:hypothetical protein